MILDEPTNHINIFGREELIRDLNHFQATLLVTTHDRNFAKAIGTHYILIKDSKIIEISSPDIFYNEQVKAITNDFDSSNNNSPIEENLQNADNNRCDDMIMEKILLIEEKLDHNLHQKKSHQKPKLKKNGVLRSTSYTLSSKRNNNSISNYFA